MRLAACRLIAVSAAALSMIAVATPAAAQLGGQQQQQQRSGQRDQQREQQESRASRQRGPAPLRQRANAGPCPFVKILYDAARYVELTDNRPTSANVGYTGEIEGVNAGCSYREADPIEVQMDLLFNLGRGPQATSDQRTYRYWVAVTERNSAVLAKEYFDLPVDFAGQPTAQVSREQTVIIPRAGIEVSGGNFEVLVGFDVTPEMAEFNRSGSRFRVNAGQPAAQ